MPCGERGGPAAMQKVTEDTVLLKLVPHMRPISTTTKWHDVRTAFALSQSYPRLTPLDHGSPPFRERQRLSVCFSANESWLLQPTQTQRNDVLIVQPLTV